MIEILSLLASFADKCCLKAGNHKHAHLQKTVAHYPNDLRLQRRAFTACFADSHRVDPEKEDDPNAVVLPFAENQTVSKTRF